VLERKVELLKILQEINGAKPIIPDRKPEALKKHIRRSGKKQRNSNGHK